MRERQAAGFILFREQPRRRFLLMKHPTRWDLPKGHAEPGESELACALREMQEETGIDPAHVSVDPVFRFSTQYVVHYEKHGDEPFLKTLVIFLGWVTGDASVRLTEHEGYGWFDWNPPHHFDSPTIDPLLAQVARHFAERDA